MLTRISAIGVVTLFLTGCGGLTKSDVPAINTWWLEPLHSTAVTAPDGSQGRQPTSVLVAIDVIPGLDTAAILTLTPDAQLNRFSGARWTGELPVLLNSLVSRSLDGSGKFEVVTRRDSRDLDRCMLRLQVRAFYAELAANDNVEDVRIAMSGDFSCKDTLTRRLEFDKRVAVGSDHMANIVAAFQSGLDQILNELIGQIQQAD